MDMLWPGRSKLENKRPLWIHIVQSWPHQTIADTTCSVLNRCSRCTSSLKHLRIKCFCLFTVYKINRFTLTNDLSYVHNIRYSTMYSHICCVIFWHAYVYMSCMSLHKLFILNIYILHIYIYIYYNMNEDMQMKNQYWLII